MPTIDRGSSISSGATRITRFRDLKFEYGISQQPLHGPSGDYAIVIDIQSFGREGYFDQPRNGIDGSGAGVDLNETEKRAIAGGISWGLTEWSWKSSSAVPSRLTAQVSQVKHTTEWILGMGSGHQSSLDGYLDRGKSLWSAKDGKIIVWRPGATEGEILARIRRWSTDSNGTLSHVAVAFSRGRRESVEHNAEGNDEGRALMVLPPRGAPDGDVGGWSFGTDMGSDGLGSWPEPSSFI